jgi:hypothetical protein
MKLSRQSRFAAALVALFCVLFSQLAIAVYACPGLLPGQEAPPALTMPAEADQDMTQDCAEMDMEQPALCQAHAQVNDQSLDKPASPHPSPSVAILLIPGTGNSDIYHRPSIAYVDAPFLAWTTPPPLAIRHCCFRI